MTELRNLQVVPFEVLHGLNMKVQKEATFHIPRTHDQFKAWLKSLHKAGNCFTCIYDEEVIFCGGVNVIFPHTGECWILCSKRIKTFVREIYHYSRIALNKIVNENNLYRLQAHIRPDWKNAINFVENLGFEIEGLCRKYINGQDYYLYARLEDF